jgi:hypothetical protein
VQPPEFSLYARHLQALRREAGRWQSNPNNPTGELAAPDAEAAVWDEAFWSLATGTWTRGDADRGAVVVGSLTKLFACPGLRVGYVRSCSLSCATLGSSPRPPRAPGSSCRRPVTSESGSPARRSWSGTAPASPCPAPCGLPFSATPA